MTRESAVLAERERNRLLRRVDWRFLLAGSRVDRMLCLAGGELRQACALVAGRVDSTPNDGVGYDAAVLTDPDARALTTAYRHLRDGGDIYAEWSSTSRPDAERLLAAAGFRDDRCYVPWPAPPRTEVWVPLDAPAAFDYVERVDRTVYVGVRHRLGVRVRRAIARRQLARNTGPVLCVVARKPAGHTGSGRTIAPSILQRAGGEARATNEHLTIALLTGGPRAISKVVGLAFEHGAAEPSFVVKWPRVPESIAGLVREADALAASHSRGPAPGVPRLLARSEADAGLAIAETPARGVPLFTRITRQNVEALTRIGASWLADFNARERMPPERDWLRTTIDAEIERFRATFGSVIDGSMLERTARLCARIVDVPLVIEHRDFGPWNLFVDDMRRLTALDWESSRLRGFPILDLIYFVSYMAFFVQGAMVSRRFVEVYRATLDQRTPMGALRHELLEQHRELLGISGAALRGLRALCWIGHADSEFQAFTADAGGAPSADALRSSVFLQLWREEIASLG